MGRAYSLQGTDTNTAGTTGLGMTGAATIRPALYDLLISSVATPADNAGEYYVQRDTAAGTSTAVTPQALDPADPASLAAGGKNHSVEPTYTASAIMLLIAMNQRALGRWVAREGKEIKVPATAANGLGLLQNAIGGAAVAMDYNMFWEE